MPDSTVHNLDTGTITENSETIAVPDPSSPSTKKTTIGAIATIVIAIFSAGAYVVSLGTGTTVGGKEVCLADGTNCPTSTASTSTWYGAIELSRATSTKLAFGSATGTSIQTTSGTIAILGFGKATGTDIFATTLRSASFSANATGATSTNIYWSATATGTTLNANTANLGALTVGGQSVCLANGTNCPTALTGITSISFTTGDFTINGGRASSTLEIMGGSLWTLANYSSAQTNVPTSTPYYLSSYGTMIPGMLFDATNTQYGFTDQIHLGDSCATTSMPITFYWTSATGTGDVVWGIRAKAVAEGEYNDSAWGSWIYATGTFTNSYYRMSTSTLTNLTPASWDSCRDTLYFQVVRNQESGDTFGGGSLLEKIVLEYGKKSLTD